jgi:YgiT-type zinc finger domain-containing protein
MNKTPAHECGQNFERIERVRDFPVRGTTVRIREELYRCTVCGEEEYSFEQAIAAQRRALQLYRQQTRLHD